MIRIWPEGRPDCAHIERASGRGQESVSLVVTDICLTFWGYGQGWGHSGQAQSTGSDSG